MAGSVTSLDHCLGSQATPTPPTLPRAWGPPRRVLLQELRVCSILGLGRCGLAGKATG